MLRVFGCPRIVFPFAGSPCHMPPTQHLSSFVDMKIWRTLIAALVSSSVWWVGARGRNCDSANGFLSADVHCYSTMCGVNDISHGTENFIHIAIEMARSKLLSITGGENVLLWTTSWGGSRELFSPASIGIDKLALDVHRTIKFTGPDSREYDDRQESTRK